MGEWIVGVLVGPAVFGLIETSEAITRLAEIGIFQDMMGDSTLSMALVRVPERCRIWTS